MGQLTLYTYFRSSCSARVRTAALLKGLDLEYVYVNLLKNEQSSASYNSVNPGNCVPTLVVTSDRVGKTVITQSIAILEFLEEYFPDSRPLLPPRDAVVARSRVRQLVNIIACDVQPPTNMKIFKRLDSMGQDHARWACDIMTDGLRAFETTVKDHAGLYCLGDAITLADVVLAPAVENALRFGVDLQSFPTVNAIFKNLTQVDAFVQGHWRHQADTPMEFRVVPSQEKP